MINPMINPWLYFGFETARHGWEAQSAVMLRCMRMFGVGVFGQTEERLVIKAEGTTLEEVQTGPASVEFESAKEVAVTVHEKPAPDTTSRQPERAPKRRSPPRPSAPTKRLGRKKR
jgi:hypothetical protein